MQWIARVNPTTYTIDALRSMTYSITYSGQVNNWLSFGVLIAFAVLGIGLATRAFRAEVKQRGGAA
jgi:ABC-type multidrug transport system permease subunit